MDVDFDRRLALCASKDDPMKLWDLKMHGEWRSSLLHIDDIDDIDELFEHLKILYLQLCTQLDCNISYIYTH